MATKTHTETPGGPKGGFPPFQADTFVSQLLWFAIAFIVLYQLMSRVALPRLASIFKERRDRIADDLAEAQRLKDESDQAGAAYEKSLAEARNRAQMLATLTREQLHSESETRRKALEGELTTKLAAADRTIAKTKAAAMLNVQGIAQEAAAAIVQRLIGKAPAPQAVEAAVKQALKG